jgi:predicted transcriptional regulator
MNAENKRALSQDQLDLIERFITAYNAIDHYLREQLEVENFVSFSSLVRDYGRRHPRWEAQDDLRMMSDLRNAMVHQRTEAYEYLSVPIPSVVEEIERIREQLTKPERVYPKFRREVVSFKAGDPFSKVLAKIHERGFSQFPVLKGEKFLGLLTEHGITRWLADHVTNEMMLVDFEEMDVMEVFTQDDKRKNYGFVARNATIMEAEAEFATNPKLEALLISESGQPNGKLLGIITRGEV